MKIGENIPSGPMTIDLIYGYNEDAVAIKKEYSDRLTLLDAASLTRIVWQYYGHFEEETRTVFPLRTLLWPRRG